MGKKKDDKLTDMIPKVILELPGKVEVPTPKLQAKWTYIDMYDEYPWCLLPYKHPKWYQLIKRFRNWRAYHAELTRMAELLGKALEDAFDQLKGTQEVIDGSA